MATDIPRPAPPAQKVCASTRSANPEREFAAVVCQFCFADDHRYHIPGSYCRLKCACRWPESNDARCGLCGQSRHYAGDNQHDCLPGPMSRSVPRRWMGSLTNWPPGLVEIDSREPGQKGRSPNG